MEGVVEVGAVIDGGHFGWGATEDFWLPCVKMGVKVDDRDRAIGTVHGAKQRKGNCLTQSELDSL